MVLNWIAAKQVSQALLRNLAILSSALVLFGAVRGVGVYPEIDRRHVKIPLTQNPASGEVIQIEFRDDDTSPGSILSKASVSTP